MTEVATADTRPLGMAGRIIVLLVLGFGTAMAAVAGATGLLQYLPYAVAGATLAIRRPRNPIGWLLILTAWCFNLTSAPGDSSAIQNGTVPAWMVALLWLSGIAGLAVFWALLVLMVIFPSGRLPTGRWRNPAILALVAGGVIVVLAAFQPMLEGTFGDGVAVRMKNPIAILPDAPIWVLFDLGMQYSVILGILVAGIVSMVIRFRRATGVEAQQLRWMVVALAAVVGGVLIGLAGAIILDNPNSPAWYAALIAFPLPPIAVGIAVLRYRLYEIDRIVSRTIGWAAITGILAVAYVGAILGLGALLAPFANSNTIAVAASTLAIAALFNPVRRRVQEVVDRRFNRAKIDAEAVANAFAGRLRDEVDLEALSVALRSTIAVAVEPTSSAIWIRSRGMPPRAT